MRGRLRFRNRGGTRLTIDRYGLSVEIGYTKWDGDHIYPHSLARRDWGWGEIRELAFIPGPGRTCSLQVYRSSGDTSDDACGSGSFRGRWWAIALAVRIYSGGRVRLDLSTLHPYRLRW